jgi:hypothetical protein
MMKIQAESRNILDGIIGKRVLERQDKSGHVYHAQTGAATDNRESYRAPG